jgi:hypothetical protein
MENQVIALARLHVLEGRQIVERRRQAIKRLESIGLDAKDETRALELLELSLAIFEDHFSELTAGS